MGVNGRVEAVSLRLPGFDIDFSLFHCVRKESIVMSRTLPLRARSVNMPISGTLPLRARSVNFPISRTLSRGVLTLSKGLLQAKHLFDFCEGKTKEEPRTTGAAPYSL